MMDGTEIGKGSRVAQRLRRDFMEYRMLRGWGTINRWLRFITPNSLEFSSSSWRSRGWRTPSFIHGRRGSWWKRNGSVCRRLTRYMWSWCVPECGIKLNGCEFIDEFITVLLREVGFIRIWLWSSWAPGSGELGDDRELWVLSVVGVRGGL